MLKNPPPTPIAANKDAFVKWRGPSYPRGESLYRLPNVTPRDQALASALTSVGLENCIRFW